MIFSVARITPSLHRIPIAVPPFSTALEAYSTYKECQSTSQLGEEKNYLEISPIGREDGIRKIIARANGRLLTEQSVNSLEPGSQKELWDGAQTMTRLLW